MRASSSPHGWAYFSAAHSPERSSVYSSASYSPLADHRRLQLVGDKAWNQWNHGTSAIMEWVSAKNALKQLGCQQKTAKIYGYLFTVYRV
jgi:hypothetical protein